MSYGFGLTCPYCYTRYSTLCIQIAGNKCTKAIRLDWGVYLPPAKKLATCKPGRGFQYTRHSICLKDGMLTAETDIGPYSSPMGL